MNIYINQLREKAGFTLRELSESTGIPRSTLHRIETSQKSPTLEQLESISIALGVKMHELFYSIHV